MSAPASATSAIAAADAFAIAHNSIIKHSTIFDPEGQEGLERLVQFPGTPFVISPETLALDLFEARIIVEAAFAFLKKKNPALEGVEIRRKEVLDALMASHPTA
jgi:hypothetical protein